MAFVSLLRSSACRGMAGQVQVLSNASRLSAGSSSSLILLKSAVKPQAGLSGVSRQQLGRTNQVQFFSVSPKSYSAGAGHSHSNLWTIERALSAALIVIIPAALASPNKLLDTIAAVSLVMHCHWGVEANVVDYIRPIIFGKTIPKIALAGVYVLSIVTMAGLLQLIYNDIGFANTVKKIWRM
ncbi:succinate dehydrogenase [ubiquinone] cytochrome b small subunit, mitochondrial [Thrips palmi]|uniref:Succinate dehydrogenase [ubiquinone] cytochrome b small subunit n=1 Tax=Thrips palmi TaxID=161013 RepID=A0A6P8ZW38_THRPL|nr:succinate dehydrogenase [ubiquinone] cytochrome b small subunit, mitochondrial [Thrips palmi]